MEFTYDARKSLRNKQKHGIDFEEAQAIWDDLKLLEAPARSDSEPRFLVIGKIVNRHWSAICTYRSDTIRIISVRRSRPEEVELYESS